MVPTDINFVHFICHFSSVLWHKCYRVSHPAALHQFMQRMLGDKIVFRDCLIRITINRGCSLHRQSWNKIPNPTHRGIENWKMYAIKQIKICAEYRDMLNRPRMDLSGISGLQPIDLSPCSWQTSLSLGSMSRYSAQILYVYIYIYINIYIYIYIYIIPIEKRL